MIKYLILTLLVLATCSITGQETNHPEILINSSNWGIETFDLPTGFAREMTVTGYEEAIFHPGWSDENDPGFWSYAFSWSINKDTFMEESELEENLIMYFDGLVGIPKDTVVAPKKPSSALLVRTNLKRNKALYIGKVRMYDRFTTKKMLTLNMTLEHVICAEKDKSILIFRFSPKDLNHNTWDELNALVLKRDVCY